MKKMYNVFSYARLILILAAMSLSLLSVRAQSIFTNPITGTNPNTSNPYTTGQTVNADITVSGIGRGTGNPGTNANDRYNANGWNSASIDLNDYFEWVLTPNSSFEIDFVSLVYTGQASGTGPTMFALRSSADGFASNIGTPTAAGTTIDLSAATYQNITSAITFRLYAWGASGSGGTFSVNSFTFNGTVSLVPTCSDGIQNGNETGVDCGGSCPPCVPNLSINDVSAVETNAGTTTFSFTVSLTVPAGAGGVTFDIATVDGTAQDDNPSSEDNDYVAKSLTGQTILAGQSTYTFEVSVNGDLAIETDETFFVNVTNVTGANVTDAQGLGTIQNDDVAAAPTTTTLIYSLNPSFTGNNVTFTATVTSGGNPVTTGTVTFTQGVTVLAANVPLNASGQAAFDKSDLTEGNHTITAIYNGTSSFLTSNGSIVQVVNNMTVVNGNSFCNTGSITLADGNTGGITGTPGTPYPSNIFVSGLSGTIQSITVDVNGLMHGKPQDIDLLLKAPTGETFIIMSGVGVGTFNNTNLTLSDAAASALPRDAAIPSGTYRPASYEADVRNIFPAPAPAGPYNQPDREGTSTFASVFNGLDPIGTWQLYATDDTSDVVGSIANGWCLNFTLQPTCTPPSISDQPDAVTECAGEAVSFSVEASGSNLTYQWQDENGNLSNNGVYSNVNTATLNISDVTGLNGRKYKVIITTDNGTPNDASDDCSTTSDEVTLTVNPLPTASVNAGSTPICAGENVVFNLMGTANAEVTYKINNGNNQIANLNANGEATITINNATADQTLMLVSVENTSTNCSQNLNASTTVTVNPTPRIDFVFKNPDNYNGLVCNGGTIEVNLVLNPAQPNLTLQDDYCFVLDNISYSLDGNTFLPGYGPLTGGGYTPDAFASVKEELCGPDPKILETLSHNENSTVYIRYNFFTKSKNAATTCDGEFRGFVVGILAKPQIAGTLEGQAFDNNSGTQTPNNVEVAICDGEAPDFSIFTTLPNAGVCVFYQPVLDNIDASVNGGIWELNNTYIGDAGNLNYLFTMNNDFLKLANPMQPGSVTWTLTPVLTGTCSDTEPAADACLGDPVTIKVIVNPAPIGENLVVEICSGEALNVNLQNQITNGLEGVSFSYTVVSNNPAVPAAANRTTPSTGGIFDTYANTSGMDATITYTITPIGTDGCLGNPFTVTIVVDGFTPGAIGNTQSVCITKEPTTLTAMVSASSSATITYKWEMSTTGCNGIFTPITDGVESDATENLVFTKPLKETTYFRRRAFSTRDGLQCEAVSNCVTITVLNVDCGQFPWTGKE